MKPCSQLVCVQVAPEASFQLQALPDVVSPPFLLRLLRIWALELRSPVAFAPMTNGLCCMYFPHGGFIATGCVYLLRGAPGETSLRVQAGFPVWGVNVMFARDIWG